jgi:hypothetical protein
MRRDWKDALDNTDTHALVLRDAVLGVEAGSCAESVQAVLEFRVAEGKSASEVLSGNLLGDLLRLRGDEGKHEKQRTDGERDEPEQQPPSRACG